jgi:hypothetical protein
LLPLSCYLPPRRCEFLPTNAAEQLPRLWLEITRPILSGRFKQQSKLQS